MSVAAEIRRRKVRQIADEAMAQLAETAKAPRPVREFNWSQPDTDDTGLTPEMKDLMQRREG